MSEATLLINHCERPYRVRDASDVSECEAFQRRVRFILNRLSPENNNKLTLEFLNLPLDCESNLKECVQLIWSKCLADHVYSALYAKLCRVMSETRVELQFMPDKYISFGTALVKKCQREFYRDFKSHVDVTGAREEIERASGDEKKHFELRLSDELAQARHDYIGNLIFMSELYKLDMIEERVLAEGIEALFRRVSLQGDLENVEFICKIIELTGAKLSRRLPTLPDNTNQVTYYLN